MNVTIIFVRSRVNESFLGRPVYIIIYIFLQRHDLRQRRWFLSRRYGGCSNDAGWLVIGGDNTPFCDWEKKFDRPQFLYSKRKTFIKWSEEKSKK